MIGWIGRRWFRNVLLLVQLVIGQEARFPVDLIPFPFSLQLQFSILIQWFTICFHYRNNAIIFFIESIYLKIFLIITLYHLIHMHTFTIFLHISCCSCIDAKFKRSYYQVYIHIRFTGFHAFQWRYHFVRCYGCDETLII